MKTYGDIRQYVLERVSYCSATEAADLADRYLSELFPLGEDFIDLCEDLEKTFGIDLRPFFEDGQPEVGWWIWRRKDARDVTVRELADEVAKLVAGAE